MLKILIIFFLLSIILYNCKELFITPEVIENKKKDILGLRGERGEPGKNKKKILTNSDKEKIRTFAQNLTYDTETNTYKYFNKPLTCVPAPEPVASAEVASVASVASEEVASVAPEEVAPEVPETPIQCAADHESVQLESNACCGHCDETVDTDRTCGLDRPYCTNYMGGENWGTCSDSPGDTCDVHHGESGERPCPAEKPMCYRKNNSCKAGKCYSYLEAPVYTQNSPLFTLKGWHKDGKWHFHSLDSMKTVRGPQGNTLQSGPVMKCENRGGKQSDNNSHVDAITGMKYIENRDSTTGRKTTGYWQLTCNPNLNGKLELEWENNKNRNNEGETTQAKYQNSIGRNVGIWATALNGATMDCEGNEHIGQWEIQFKNSGGNVRPDFYYKCVPSDLFKKNKIELNGSYYNNLAKWKEGDGNISISYFDRNELNQCNESSKGIHYIKYLGRRGEKQRFYYKCNDFKQK